MMWRAAEFGSCDHCNYVSTLIKRGIFFYCVPFVPYVQHTSSIQIEDCVLYDFQEDRPEFSIVGFHCSIYPNVKVAVCVYILGRKFYTLIG